MKETSLIKVPIITIHLYDIKVGDRWLPGLRGGVTVIQHEGILGADGIVLSLSNFFGGEGKTENESGGCREKEVERDNPK